jgi:predicted ATPase
MELKGRDAELRIIGERVDAVAGGVGGMLVVEGSPGSGKSSLLAEARSLAARVGVSWCAGEGSAAHARVPFAPLLAALDGHGPAGDREFVVLADIERGLLSAARATSLVFTLDDLHDADAETLLALSSLPSRLAGAPILWVLASGPGRPVVRDLLALLVHRGARRLSLGPLADDAVDGVIADVLGLEPGPELLDLAAGAGGEPYLLVELLRGLREEHRVRVEDGCAAVVGAALPRRLVHAIQARLAPLTEDARRAVRLASSLPADRLTELLEHHPSALLRGIDEARSAGLLVEDGDHYRLRCELLRQAVLEAAPVSFRSASLELVAA